MGSSKKHKKNKSERREKYEEYSNNQDPAHLQRGLKLILKVGSNSTPEYSANSPLTTLNVIGPPTAAEAMMSAAPGSPMTEEPHPEEYRERHKKSKKKKKKKDREKRHKHHKEKRHRSERHSSREMQHEPSSVERVQDEESMVVESNNFMEQRSPRSVQPPSVPAAIAEADSSQDGFSFMDDENDQSQPLPENILFYAGITTDNSPSNRPVSKAIIPRKCEDILLGSSPASVSQQSSSQLGVCSPTKPLPDLLIPSPSPSTAASTPGGGGSLSGLTPKALEAPKTPSTSSESGREPRSCVLKLKQQKSPLNKLLEHLLRFLEKRDPHQFFAWPVTDDIAPGYSSIISKPMDFSTMRQKIDDHDYATLTEFSDDFKLMCENAIRYNHVDTVYHKAAKRLLQVGIKQLQPDSLMRSLKPLSGYMRELTAKELGFELSTNEYLGYEREHDSGDEFASMAGVDDATSQPISEEEERKRTIRSENEPKTRFEPYVDDLTSEEILAQVQGAAQQAKKRLTAQQKAYKMGFLRQNKDGSTSLNVLIKDENEGPEKVITLGDLVGKLQNGSGQLQGLREDKRNQVKPVKSLSYGAFASFAPAFDSRFSSLSAEETQLVLNTYGNTASAEYAESLLQFTKDSSYATTLANGLLDIMTNGEHSKSMEELHNMQLQKYEQTEIQKCFNTAQSAAVEGTDSEVGKLQKPTAKQTREEIEVEYEKYKNTRVDFNQLRSLKDIGIEIDFLDNVEVDMKNFELTRRLQEHLCNNLNIIEKLRVTQHERLSQPLPAHLSLVAQATPEETQIAHQLTQQLTEAAKKLPPESITDTYALRKAMGMSYVGLPPPPQAATQRIPLPEVLQQPVAMPQLPVPNPSEAAVDANATSSKPTLASTTPAPENSLMEIDDDVVASVVNSNNGVDLENELREFLESGSGIFL